MIILLVLLVVISNPTFANEQMERSWIISLTQRVQCGVGSCLIKDERLAFEKAKSLLWRAAETRCIPYGRPDRYLSQKTIFEMERVTWRTYEYIAGLDVSVKFECYELI